MSILNKVSSNIVKEDLPVGEENLWKFTEQEVLCAEIAGLCHDLGIRLSAYYPAAALFMTLMIKT